MAILEGVLPLTLDRLLMGDEVFAITGFLSFVIARLLVPLSWWYAEKIYEVVALCASANRVHRASSEAHRGPHRTCCDCTSGAYYSDACAELGEREDVLSPMS